MAKRITIAECLKYWPNGYRQPTKAEFLMVEADYLADREFGHATLRQMMIRGEPGIWLPCFYVFMPELKPWFAEYLRMHELNARSI